jgi:hypothetical protein
MTDEERRRNEVREASDLGHKYGEANVSHSMVLHAARMYFEALGTDQRHRAELIKSIDAAANAVAQEAAAHDAKLEVVYQAEAEAEAKERTQREKR